MQSHTDGSTSTPSTNQGIGTYSTEGGLGEGLSALDGDMDEINHLVSRVQSSPRPNEASSTDQHPLRSQASSSANVQTSQDGIMAEAANVNGVKDSISVKLEDTQQEPLSFYLSNTRPAPLEGENDEHTTVEGHAATAEESPY